MCANKQKNKIGNNIFSVKNKNNNGEKGVN
jgi:hypothetical protein